MLKVAHCLAAQKLWPRPMVDATIINNIKGRERNNSVVSRPATRDMNQPEKKVNYLKKVTDKNLGERGSSVVLERIIDLFVLSLFALFGALLLINYFSMTMNSPSFKA